MFAGIDTHKDTLAVGVVDAIGKAAAAVEVPNTRAGFIALAALFAHHEVRRVGIEGSGKLRPQHRRLPGTGLESG